MIILVINCGSSSLKYEVYEMPAQRSLGKGLVERIGLDNARIKQSFGERCYEKHCEISNHRCAFEFMIEALLDEESGIIKSLKDIEGIGHRVVHGGEQYAQSVIIDDQVMAAIEANIELAPLHNPANITGIQESKRVFEGVPQVAVFDTSFHQTLSPSAYLYGIPRELYDKYRIRRYGFHGTSHRYVARRCAKLLGADKTQANIITCHLGNGCSITAVKAGKSVDTSMGLTPLEGLVMGTRCGDIDPAILFFLGEKGYTVQQLNTMCNKQSGLLGISGASNDMRNLLTLVEQGHDRAKLAVDIFCYRITKYIGAYTAVLGRLDAVVFTGGIGENNSFLRARICADQPQIGMVIDPARNTAKASNERLISSDDSRVKVFVIPTDEEAAIAADTCELAK